MRMIRTKNRSCSGKRPYTKKQARARAALLRRERFGRYHAYRCRHCRYWHVGHTQTRKRKRW